MLQDAAPRSQGDAASFGADPGIGAHLDVAPRVDPQSTCGAQRHPCGQLHLPPRHQRELVDHGTEGLDADLAGDLQGVAASRDNPLRRQPGIMDDHIAQHLEVVGRGQRWCEGRHRDHTTRVAQRERTRRSRIATVQSRVDGEGHDTAGADLQGARCGSSQPGLLHIPHRRQQARLGGAGQAQIGDRPHIQVAGVAQAHTACGRSGRELIHLCSQGAGCCDRSVPGGADARTRQDSQDTCLYVERGGPGSRQRLSHGATGHQTRGPLPRIDTGQFQIRACLQAHIARRATHWRRQAVSESAGHRGPRGHPQCPPRGQQIDAAALAGHPGQRPDLEARGCQHRQVAALGADLTGLIRPQHDGTRLGLQQHMARGLQGDIAADLQIAAGEDQHRRSRTGHCLSRALCHTGLQTRQVQAAKGSHGHIARTARLQVLRSNFQALCTTPQRADAARGLQAQPSGPHIGIGIVARLDDAARHREPARGEGQVGTACIDPVDLDITGRHQVDRATTRSAQTRGCAGDHTVLRLPDGSRDHPRVTGTARLDTDAPQGIEDPGAAGLDHIETRLQRQQTVAQGNILIQAQVATGGRQRDGTAVAGLHAQSRVDDQVASGTHDQAPLALIEEIQRRCITFAWQQRQVVRVLDGDHTGVAGATGGLQDIGIDAQRMEQLAHVTAAIDIVAAREQAHTTGLDVQRLAVLGALRSANVPGPGAELDGPGIRGLPSTADRAQPQGARLLLHADMALGRHREHTGQVGRAAHDPLSLRAQIDRQGITCEGLDLARTPGQRSICKQLDIPPRSERGETVGVVGRDRTGG